MVVESGKSKSMVPAPPHVPREVLARGEGLLLPQGWQWACHGDVQQAG